MGTCLNTCLMVQSLKFSVTGSKIGMDILVIQKSNHFDSKFKQIGSHFTRWEIVSDDPHSKEISKVFLSLNYYYVFFLLY